MRNTAREIGTRSFPIHIDRNIHRFHFFFFSVYNQQQCRCIKIIHQNVAKNVCRNIFPRDKFQKYSPRTIEYRNIFIHKSNLS